MNKLGEIIELLEEHEPNVNSAVVEHIDLKSFKDLYISLVENLITILGDE